MFLNHDEDYESDAHRFMYRYNPKDVACVAGENATIEMLSPTEAIATYSDDGSKALLVMDDNDEWHFVDNYTDAATQTGMYDRY